MTPEEIKALEKEVSKLKFKANQKAGEVHDLVEDRLLSDFEDLMGFTETTYEACKAWSIKSQELIAAKKS
ncbi:CCE_0567 family metalloprotein [Bacteroidales bacterium]|nr:CCE_0567 family metalloprotein [Bacteroidales bacterium]